MQILWKQAYELSRFLRSRLFAMSLVFAVLAIVVVRVSDMTKAVYVVNSNSRTLRYVMADESEDLLGRFGFRQGAAPVQFQGTSGNFAQIDAHTVLGATIVADGKTITAQVPNGTTVAEFLHRNNIVYDGNDLLSPAAEKPIADGEKIVLNRVDYEEYTVSQKIPYETVRKASPLVTPGAVKRVQEGKTGTKELTYVKRTVDGRQEEVQLLGEHVTNQPVQETILVGSVQPVSPLDFDLEVDENGKPLHYKQLLTEQIATGYSARPGAKTASGRYAIPGHVAVNPNVIPYGSKLYITSADGRFIYGCAIAADTGTGLLAGIVDVDLFYDTYIESAMNGRKILDIYVLE